MCLIAGKHATAAFVGVIGLAAVGAVDLLKALGVVARPGLDPQPFVMAVLYGASCSSLTPYGYQTNLMIMSPGDTRRATSPRRGAAGAGIPDRGPGGDTGGVSASCARGWRERGAKANVKIDAPGSE